MNGMTGQPQFLLGLGIRVRYPSVTRRPGHAADCARSYWSSRASLELGKSTMVYFRMTPDLAEELFDSTHVILRQNLPMPSSLWSASRMGVGVVPSTCL